VTVVLIAGSYILHAKATYENYHLIGNEIYKTSNFIKHYFASHYIYFYAYFTMERRTVWVYFCRLKNEALFVNLSHYWWIYPYVE